MKHDFHFVLTIELKEYIINYASMNNMGISKAIIHIIEIMKPVLKKHYLKDVKCQIGKYREFGADTNTHVYLDNTEYKFLKKIKNNLNIFSTAMILRWLLEEFFIGLCKYGIEKFLKIIERYNNIHYLDKNKRWLNNNYIKQHMLLNLTNEIYMKLAFSKEYELLSIEFST